MFNTIAAEIRKFPFNTISTEIRKWFVQAVLAAIGLPDIEAKLNCLVYEVEEIDFYRRVQMHPYGLEKETAAECAAQTRDSIARIRPVLIELVKKVAPGSAAWINLKLSGVLSAKKIEDTRIARSRS